MSNPTNSNVFISGTDGGVPIHNPEGRFATYALREIYTGTVGENRYVPNVGDLVIDVEQLTDSLYWKVTALSAELIPRLVPWGNVSTSILNPGDIMTGAGPSSNGGNTKRIYYDKSVTPHVLAVDQRLSYKNTEARYARIYRGTAAIESPKIVSGFYDNLGNLIGHDIPLTLVGQDAGSNRSEYMVPICYTAEDLPDNEVLTVVIYSAAGHVVSRDQCIVVNTSFIRGRNTSVKYITHISMSTPFMSETDPTLINLPVNVLLQGLFPMGHVHYSDGSVRDMPVDGTKFTLLGMQDYMASRINQRVPVTLRYTLSENEVAYGANVGEFYHITQQYQIRTIQAKGAYNVKLFGYPEWVSPTAGYTMRWWLYNTDRNIRQDVTSLVRYAANAEPFQPTLYGASQSLNVHVMLSEVNPIFENWRYSQVTGVALLRQGTERSTNWSISFDPGQDPAFGRNNFVNLEFINYNYYKLNLKGDCLTQDEWLERLYLRTRPLFDPLRELEAPLPTHYRIRKPNEVLEYPIAEWNQTVSVLNGLSVDKTLYIEWIRKTPENDLELGITGIPIYPATGL